MEKYSTLKKMGIDNPKQIFRYTVTQVKDADHLRVIYRRKKLSMLPVSRRYVFGRSTNTEIVDSGTQKTNSVKEVSPNLIKAMNELDGIVKANQTNKNLIEDLNEEIIRFEVEMVSTLASMRSLVKRIEKGECE